MDGSLPVQLELFALLLGRPLRIPDVGVAQVVLDVLVTDHRDPVAMLCNEMGEWRRGALAIKRVSNPRGSGSRRRKSESWPPVNHEAGVDDGDPDSRACDQPGSRF